MAECIGDDIYHAINALTDICTEIYIMDIISCHLNPSSLYFLLCAEMATLQY